MTGRIRWHDEDGSRDFAALTGYVGTINVPQFKIYEPDDRGGGHGAEWLLMSRLPGQDTARYADDPQKLKAEAERLLAGFVTSLGAAFPAAGNWHDGWEPRGRDGDGNLLLWYRPAEAMYRVLPEEDL